MTTTKMFNIVFSLLGHTSGGAYIHILCMCLFMAIDRQMLLSLVSGHCMNFGWHAMSQFFMPGLSRKYPNKYQMILHHAPTQPFIESLELLYRWWDDNNEYYLWETVKWISGQESLYSVVAISNIKRNARAVCMFLRLFWIPLLSGTNWWWTGWRRVRKADRQTERQWEEKGRPFVIG